MEEIRVIIKSLVRTSQHGNMKLQELKTLYRQQEGEELISVIGKFGFASIENMLRSWEEFEVYGCSLGTTVKCNDLDHISAMNKFAK